VYLEPGFAAQTFDALRALGHRVEPAVGGAFGGYQAILRDGAGVYHGASESRKDGHAAGY
jgi:gamma-glutamyltranspeptidase/glutathione hydrolase